MTLRELMELMEAAKAALEAYNGAACAFPYKGTPEERDEAQAAINTAEAVYNKLVDTEI